MKPVFISIGSAVIAGILIWASFSIPQNSNGVGESDGSNVTIVDGTQIIEITAKGGYFPRSTVAKADMPTILRVKTEGTFDCSSSISIPDLNYRANLEPSGVTKIEIPPQKSGTSFDGFCAMGMYNFEVDFE